MTKAEELTTMLTVMGQASINSMQRMRERDRRMRGRNKLRLKKSRRRIANKSKRGNR